MLESRLKGKVVGHDVSDLVEQMASEGKDEKLCKAILERVDVSHLDEKRR